MLHEFDPWGGPYWGNGFFFGLSPASSVGKDVVISKIKNGAENYQVYDDGYQRVFFH